MKTFFGILGQKPIIGAASGFGVFLASITFNSVLGYTGLILAIGVSGLTFLIKWKEAGGIAGIVKIIKNWKNE